MTTREVKIMEDMFFQKFDNPFNFIEWKASEIGRLSNGHIIWVMTIKPKEDIEAMFYFPQLVNIFNTMISINQYITPLIDIKNKEKLEYTII